MARHIAAAGYRSLDFGPLGGRVIDAGMIIDKNIEEDFIYQIVNTKILAPLLRCGDVIEFQKPVRVGPWRRDYEMNQKMIPDQPQSGRFCLSICEEAYKSIKIDEVDIDRMCNDWAAYETSMLSDTWTQLSALWHHYLLNRMLIHVPDRNTGKRAGRLRNIDLGTIGNALHLTPTNIAQFLPRIRRVLQENGRWYEGEMFAIVPREFSNLLLQTAFEKQMCCNIGDSVMFKGLVARDILGFTIIESDYLRPVQDPATNRFVYPILAGWNEAFAFAGDIVKADVQHIPQTWGRTYNMLSVFGGGAIYPEALVKAHVSFSTEGTGV